MKGSLLHPLQPGRQVRGPVDVAAHKPHSALTEWVLEETMENSVCRNAGAICLPEGFEQVGPDEGIGHYREMCATCHGGPGISRDEIGQGLYPLPPDLQDSAEATPPAELYWVIRNGINPTGMPAFEPTHTDKQLWQIKALIHHLPRMTPEEYRRLLEPADETNSTGHEHEHEDDGHSSGPSGPSDGS